MKIYPCLIKFVSQNFCQIGAINENRGTDQHSRPPKKVGQPREEPPYLKYKS